MKDQESILNLAANMLEYEEGSFEDRIERYKRHGLDEKAFKVMTRHNVSYENAVLMILEISALRRPHLQSYLRKKITREEYQSIRYTIDRFCIDKYTGNKKPD